MHIYLIGAGYKTMVHVFCESKILSSKSCALVLKRALEELELAKLYSTVELYRLEGIPSRATYS